MKRPARTTPARWLLACAFFALGIGGCAKPLLSPSEPRSPFDRYDAVRNRHAPQYIEDEYGRQQPNLRGRLEPRN